MPNQKLTPEKILKVAKQYKSIKEWRINYHYSYNQARKIGKSFFKKCSKNMINEKKMWDLNKIKKIVKNDFKNKKRVYFYRKYPGAISWVRTHKKQVELKSIFDKYCQKSGIRDYKPLWTEKQLISFFKKFKSLSEMKTHPKGISAYCYALKIKKIDKLSSHFLKYNYSTSVGEESTRYFLNKIFKEKFVSIKHPQIINPKTGKKLELDGYCEKLKIAFEFGDHRKPFYGRDSTNNLQKDKIKNKRCKELNIKLIKVVWGDKFDSQYSAKIKNILLKEFIRLKIKVPSYFYKTKFKVIQINKKYKYSKKEIMNCVKKCKNRTDFEKNHGGMLNTAGILGFQQEIIEYFRKKLVKSGLKPVNFWNEKNIKECAKKCKNLTEFYTKYRGAYKKSLKLKISDSLTFKTK